MNEEVKFKHIISLGSFCSPALEIERHGFRDASYPFDWVLSKSFKEVMNLLQTEFHDYLSNNMYQCLDAPYTYVNMEKKIWFVHDFDPYKSLDSQIEEVKEKYRRRVIKFYEAVKEPTLFIRYIEDINEIEFIAKNYERILALLQKWNEGNDIVFVMNEDLCKYSSSYTIPSAVSCYVVRKDEGDSVARKFFDQTPELLEELTAHYYSPLEREKNISFYQEKMKIQKKKKIKKRIRNFVYKLIGKQYYRHDLVKE